MPLHLVLLGPPASGKGTQGKRVAKREKIDYLSTGALLREAASGTDEVAADLKKVLARGGYVDDDFICRLMHDWLERHTGGWVLDGFPRTMAQHDFLHEWLVSTGQRLDAAIALEVPKEILIERIENRVECPECRWGGQAQQLVDGNHCPKCGAVAGRRADDTTENFLNRYHEFATHTIPVMDQYAAEGSLIRCDASDDIDRVTDSIAKSIHQHKSHGQAQENP